MLTVSQSCENASIVRNFTLLSVRGLKSCEWAGFARFDSFRRVVRAFRSPDSQYNGSLFNDTFKCPVAFRATKTFSYITRRGVDVFVSRVKNATSPDPKPYLRSSLSLKWSKCVQSLASSRNKIYCCPIMLFDNSSAPRQRLFITTQ